MNRISCPASWLAIALAFLVSAHARAADDYKGANAILTQIASATGQSAAGALSPGAQWLADVAAFHNKSSSLPPDEAAAQWLNLADRYVAFSMADFASLTASDRGRLMSGAFGGGSPGELISALPGPPAWPALARMIDKRPPQSASRNASFEAALRLLAHTLIADPAGQGKAVEALMNIKDPSFPEFIDLPSLEDALADQSDDPSAVATGFQTKIARQQKLIAQSSATGQYNFVGSRFAVPDLVTILGAKEAEPLLREAVLLPQTELSISGAETNDLARKVALEEVGNMKTPHWELAGSLDGAPLFEAFQKRFPDASLQGNAGDSGDYPTARQYYFLHLIVTGQAGKAIAMADSLQGDNSSSIPVDELDRAGYTRQVADFLHDLLTKHPELPLWNDYISLAAKTGQTTQMLALIRSVASRTDLSTSQRGNAHKAFYLALLAADQIDEGIAELRKVISTAGSSGATDPDDSPCEKNVALARLGQLLGRQDLLEEGIAGAKKHLLNDANTTWDSSTAGSLAELLVEIGRGPEAEDLLGQVIPRFRSGYRVASEKRECLADLVRVYFKAGRPDDVLTLLDQYPGWGVADLKDILTQDTDGFTIAEYSTHAAADDYPVGYMAAWALAQQGQKDAALKILNALLDQEGGFDPGYELLTKLSGQDAIPRLDELARRDRFETRPLIWKAQLQLDAGNLDDAEKTVRAAITIDPSDGEQGPGRRMREYAVLADILDRKGDKEHAQIYRGAVTAIRMSEHADRFYEAGLLTRAVAMYEEALTHFADAYCIQSRLALRLAELGDNTGAEEHYRRAYELMPESFGRVESHCFGCERAFEGSTAQGIAEKVFTQLAVKMPAKPQVHYLLGYLRNEQQRYSEALPEFEQAVKLDPDYLNAWKEIGGLAENMHLPAKLRNEVALNQVRLDPLQRHGHAQATYVTDLAGFWNALAAAEKLQPPPPGPLLPLTASAAEMTHPKPAANTSAPSQPIASVFSVIGNALFSTGGPATIDVGADDDTPDSFDVANFIESYSERHRNPATAIAENRFIAAASQVFSAMPNWISQ
jgi:tetratricopeptide (TPR) repeat protein